MTKRQLTSLILASYTKDTLDEKKALRIANALSRKDLKLYIRGLKLLEKSKEISLVIPNMKIYNTTRKSVEKIFKKKKIKAIEDPSLLLGIKIIDNDMEYEMNLKERLENVLEEINQTYS